MLPLVGSGKDASLHRGQSQYIMTNCLEQRLTLSNNLTALLVGCAPTPNQYFILSTFNSTFFSFAIISSVPFAKTLAAAGGVLPSRTRGMGSYTPKSSRGLPSRGRLELIATRWKMGFLRWP